MGNRFQSNRAVSVLGGAMLCILLCGVTMAAEPAAPKPLSLDEALRIARENSMEYRTAVLRQRQAKEKVSGAWGQLMPALESEASLMRQGAENGFMSLSDGQYDLKFVQLRFGINPGAFYNQLQMSRKALIVAEEEVRRVRAEVDHAVIKSYFDLILAAEMIKLRRESVELLKTNLRDVENLYRTGSVPKFELLQAQVQLKSQEPLLLDAENGYGVMLDTFNYNLGAEGTLYREDAGILDAGSYRAPAGETAQKIAFLTLAAVKNRPEIIQLENRRAMAGHAKNIASSQYLWPTFSVGGYYGLTKYLSNPVDIGLTLPPALGEPDFSAISGDREWQNTWQVRVAATYRWGALIPTDPSRAVEREEKLKTAEAEEEFARIKRRIAIAINAAYTRLVTSSATIASQKENVETAREGLRIARESYRAGVIRNAELLASELALSNARTSYINAVHGYYVSLASLKKEIGSDDERIILEEKTQ